MSPDRIQLNDLAFGVGPIVNEGRKGGEISDGAAERRLENKQLIGAANLDPDVPTFPLKKHGVFNKIHAAHATGLSNSGPSNIPSRPFGHTVNGTGLNHSRSSVHPCADEGAADCPRLSRHTPANDAWSPLGAV